MLRQFLLSTSFSFFSLAVLAQNSLPENESDQLFALGVELHEKGKYQASRHVFEDFIANHGDHFLSADAQYYVAFNAISTEQKDAEFLMEGFIENNPSHIKAASAYLDLGNFYFDQAQYKKASTYFERVNFSGLSFESSSEAKFKLGYCYFSLKRTDDALEYFKQASEIRNPYYESAQYYSGYIYFQEQVYELAIPHFLEAEKSDEYREVVPPMLAKSYLLSYQYESLISYTNQLGKSKLDPRIQLLTAEAHFYIEEFNRAADLYELAIIEGRRNDPVVYYHQGIANYKIDQPERAINAFKKAALSADTLRQFSSYYLGLLYTQTDQKQYAINAFETAALENFDLAIKEESAFRIGQLYYELGQFSYAIDHLTSFTTNFSNSQFVLQANDLLSDALLKTNNYDVAINYIESLSNKSESINRVYQKVTFLKGSQQFNDSQFPEAIRNFDKSLSVKLDPEFVISAYHWKGEAYSIGQKWVEAINAYSRIVFNSDFVTSPIYNKARYGLGYAYYNSKVYDRAKIQFSAFTGALNGAFDQPLYLDGLVRLGDCYFVEKNYTEAIASYEIALRGRSKDRAYIYFQLGLANGFNDRPDIARSNFEKVIEEFPNTRMAERSTYQWAQLDFENGSFESSISQFTALVNNYPSSDFVPYALLKRAVANFNLQQYNPSVSDYTRILDEYTSHEVANGALLGLQEVQSAGGVSVNIDQYIAKYRQANPDDSSLESVEFEVAKNRYFSQDYSGAISKFNTFNENYPESSLKGEVLYFIADSYNRSGDATSALQYFYQVLDHPHIAYYNRSIQRLADLEFATGNYDKAIEHYSRLGRIARNQKETYNSRAGLMLSHDQISNSDSVEYYAKTILGASQLSSNGISAANLYLGKTAISKEEYVEAIGYLEETANVANDKYAAQATYLIGEVYHLQGNYEKSNEILFEMNSKFSIYEYWLGKSFLLIADNYFETNELFQAEATLNSVIEKSPVEEIVESAKSKLEIVKAKGADVIEEPDQDGDSSAVSGTNRN